jgi:long-subunit fatty acid transport protein
LGVRHIESLLRIAACAALGFVVTQPAVARDTQSLGAWRDYALQGLAPDFDWARSDTRSAAEPTVLSTALAPRTTLMPAMHFVDAGAGRVGLAVSRSIASDTPAFESGGISALTVTSAGTGLERTMLAPSISRQFGEDTAVTGAVVLAYQYFATWGLGASQVDLNSSPLPPGYAESSFGTGVRLGFQQRLSESIGFNAEFQTRVDMDAFENYRGVYAEPGDFDIPAVAKAGLEWQPAERVALGFDVARVMYSEMNAFTSQALPTRFLSLLGDGVAPDFAWQDLTVYAADLTFRATPRDVFELRYTTQQQPVPTSDLLSSVLAPEYTDDNFAVSWSRRVGAAAMLRLAASYAPSQYFLGNASYLDDGATGAQVEVEAVWTVRF